MVESSRWRGNATCINDEGPAFSFCKLLHVRTMTVLFYCRGTRIRNYSRRNLRFAAWRWRIDGIHLAGWYCDSVVDWNLIIVLMRFLKLRFRSKICMRDCVWSTLEVTESWWGLSNCHMLIFMKFLLSVEYLKIHYWAWKILILIIPRHILVLIHHRIFIILILFYNSFIIPL